MLTPNFQKTAYRSVAIDRHVRDGLDLGEN